MMHHLGLKVFAVLIGLLLWLIVTTDIRIATISVPIEVQNLPSDSILLSDFTQQATVKVSGPRFLVSEVVATPPVFLLQMPSDVSEQFTVALRGDELSLPSAVRVLAIEPGEITVQFDKRVTRRIPVQVPRIGTLPKDYQIISTEITPTKVDITGPEREVSRLEEVETFPVDLRRVEGDTSREIELRKPGVKTSVNPGKVRWAISVRPVEEVRSIRSVPITIKGDFELGEVSIRPSTVTLQVRGRPTVLDSLLSKGITASVVIEDSAALKEGYELPVNVDISSGVELRRVTPRVVSVQLKGSGLVGRK
jgi:YbbR domain-containing protein